MKWLLLFVSLLAVFLLSKVEPQIPYIKPSALLNADGMVRTSGMVFGGKLCVDKCIQIVGANGSGYREITGQVVKRAEGAALFVRKLG